MKAKKDFVTNSSSCSFIFLGWKVDIKDAELMEKLCISFNVDPSDKSLTEVAEEISNEAYGKIDCCEVGDYENGFEDGFIYIGVKADTDEDGTEMKLSEVKDEVKNCGAMETGLFNMDDVVLIGGVRMC